MKPEIQLGIAWACYCLIHSLMARTSFKARMEKLMGSFFRYYRFIYSFLALALLILLLLWQFSIASRYLFRPGAAVILLAVLTAACGLVVMLACTRKYIREIMGLDAFRPEKKSGPVLYTHGFHAYTRHPLYLGTLLFIVGITGMIPLLSNVIASAVIIIYLFIGIQLEEAKLLQDFGERYKQYKQRVPMLLPRFRSKNK